MFLFLITRKMRQKQTWLSEVGFWNNSELSDNKNSRPTQIDEVLQKTRATTTKLMPTATQRHTAATTIRIAAQKWQQQKCAVATATTTATARTKNRVAERTQQERCISDTHNNQNLPRQQSNKKHTPPQQQQQKTRTAAIAATKNTHCRNSSNKKHAPPQQQHQKNRAAATAATITRAVATAATMRNNDSITTTKMRWEQKQQQESAA